MDIKKLSFNSLRMSLLDRQEPLLMGLNSRVIFHFNFGTWVSYFSCLLSYYFYIGIFVFCSVFNVVKGTQSAGAHGH